MTPDQIKQLVLASGAAVCGIAEAAPVAEAETARYDQWLAEGKQGEMQYLEKYSDIRRDPRLLLHGAQSIIVAAYPYYSADCVGPDGLQWARYSLGRDYHDVIRERLSAVAEAIREATGADTRVCVDTAPLHERYWALRAGIGVMGINGQLITSSAAGSWVLLGEIITSHPLTPDAPSTGWCIGCGRCLRACPGRALDGSGGLDARKCLSYSTIEYRGAKNFTNGDHIYGCDVCQEVCPHNRHASPSPIPDFAPRQAILALTRPDIAEMTQPEFSQIFSKSAIKRTKLAGLKRNL